MSEAILFTIAAEILKKFASTALNQIGLTTGFKRDLKELQETLSTIKAVLLDAEEKQSTNHQLRLWLERLQDVLYDADNVLDEFAYVALQQQPASSGNLKTKIIIGRDKDINNIVHLLTSNHTDLNLFVIPIVGIGGLGKTTIAKLVFNDSRVDKCFQPKMWVCISDNFNLKNVIKAIISEADPNGNDCSNLSINQLQIRLRGILQNKKILLVLDDVWNEDVEKWKHLEELLTNGAKGSAIIVTTRSHKVASIMETTKPYILERLSDKDCWCLFAKCAFEKGKEKNYPNLVRIGKDIIVKCKGVPLAVRSLGCMLFMKTDEHEWRSIK